LKEWIECDLQWFVEAKFADVPDALWRRIEPLIPPERDKPRGGRPPVASRIVMAGILYRLKTGCQWKALPNDFGSGSTCHLRFQRWVQLGVFASIHRELLKYYDDRRGISWKWSSLDSASVKAPKGGTSRARTRRTARKAA
jgi:putative transposase